VAQTERVPNQPKTPLRALRVPDDLWHRAQAVAKERGETLSDVMRDALWDYVEKYGKRKK
jgi:predicted transcriptional regulator